MTKIYSAIHYPKTNKNNHSTALYNNYTELKKALLSAKLQADSNSDSPIVQILSEQEYEEYNRMSFYANSWFRPSNTSSSGADYDCTFELQYPWPVLVIEDNNVGGTSVTNSALAIVKEVEQHTQINLVRKPIVYMDSMGLYSQIIYDGSNILIKTIQEQKTFTEVDEAVVNVDLQDRTCYDTSSANMLNILFSTSKLINPMLNLCVDRMITTNIGDRKIALVNTYTNDDGKEYTLTGWENNKADCIYIFEVCEPTHIMMEFFSKDESSACNEIDPSDQSSIETYNDMLKNFLFDLLQKKIELSI